MSEGVPDLNELDEFLQNPASKSRLLQLLREIWASRQNQVEETWRRTLTFGDYIVDRWSKAKTLGFGEGTSVYDSVLVFGNVTVGPNTWIGPFVLLDGSGGLEIGSNCSISAGVQIYSHDSVQWAITGGTAPYEYARTKIENNCYIGPNTIIAKGVTIGTGAIVGANSLVLKNIPAGGRAYGNPCRLQS